MPLSYNSHIEYIRDKRSPTPKNAAVSRVMSANRARNTSPEITLRKALWHSGHRGYRLHYKIKLPSCLRRGGREAGGVVGAVRPDISFVSKKAAIFVMGCFWHRCPKCNYALPKTNRKFWQAKFERNVTRDARKRTDLRRLGWRVIFVWECDLKKRPQAILTRIHKTLS